MRAASRLLAGLLAAAAVSCSSAPDHVTQPPTTSPQPAVSSPPPCSAQTSTHGFTITMRDDRFHPACLVVAEGFPFRLVNRGSTKHNFTIAGTKVSIDVAPGQAVHERSLRALGVHTGVYRFYCRFHRSKGMTGELHVLAA
jgi:plastocyanin